MPHLIDFYEEFNERRDEFEILAFHSDNRETFDDLDPDLEECKATYWKGRNLPFPILLDSTGQTIRELGVTSYPTLLLIGPDGTLRREGGLHTLRAELMKTDPDVAKPLKQLKRLHARSFVRAARDVAAKDDDKAAWVLMLLAQDEKAGTEKRVLAILPLLAGMKSEMAHGFLLGAHALASKSAKVRLAAIKALQTLETPPEFLPVALSRALQREEDKKVRKLLEVWMDELRKEAEAESSGS